MGLVSGLLAASAYAVDSSKSSSQGSDTTKESVDDDSMSESDLLEELSPEGKKLYENLDAQGKALALRVASQKCQGFNECKGLNACKTNKNSCEGLASCKGNSKCSFTDKNNAVKAVYNKKMAEKRQNLPL